MNKDFHWIRRNIISCTNRFQLECGHAMIHLFKQKYADTAGVNEDYNSLLETIHAKELLIIAEIEDIIDC